MKLLRHLLLPLLIIISPLSLSADPPGLARAIQVQDAHTPSLLSIPGVVGTGIGLNAAGKPVIKIFTTRAGIPDLPVNLEGHPVHVEVTGMVIARADTTARFPRPVPIGVSSGHPDITAGTIGVRVTDGNHVYALSNNHVYANSNGASVGDNVIQPGSYDGGIDPDDAIGTLADYEEIDFTGANNAMDAAIAQTNAVDCATPSDGYGAPGTTPVEANVNDEVMKYGRTTGFTHGSVAEINVTVEVCYQTRGPFSCKKSATFVNQFSVTPGTFSAGGDSGSLIVTDDGNSNPVGLLFAGGSSRTFANPIVPVLNRFAVTIDDCSTAPDTNNPPLASFSYTTTDLTASFTDASTDSDGGIVDWSWDFGDGNTSTAQSPNHNYGSTGAYSVTLTVTDDDGATDAESQLVTVSTGDEINLSATGYKIKGLQKVDLTWSGATSGDIAITRNGNDLATTNNDGAYTDNIDLRGNGSYTYKICEAGTATCSNEISVNF